MKRALKMATNDIWHHVNGMRVDGPPPSVRGNLTGVRGNLTGVWGNLSNVRGNLDECELTDAERANGVNIADLIAE